MRKIVSLLSVILCVLIVSCTPDIKSDPISLNLSTVTSTNVVTASTTTSVENTTYTYPSSIDITYQAGMIMENWTSNDSTPIMGHKKGEAMAVTIHDGKDISQVFTVSVVLPDDGSINPPSDAKLPAPSVPSNWSVRHQGWYPVAPPEILNYVELGFTTVTLQPNETVRDPISIKLPDSFLYVGLMEFRILITQQPEEAEGGVYNQAASTVRVFMEHK